MKPIKNVDSFPKLIIAILMIILTSLLPTQYAFGKSTGIHAKKAKHQNSQMKYKKAKFTKKKKYVKKKIYKKPSVQRQVTIPAPVSSGAGVASWYGPGFHGRLTASGQRFNQNALTTAHKTLPFGTKLLVTNVRNGKSVVVTVNDRGPFVGNRVLDLSKGAFHQIASSGAGLISVKYEVLSVGDGKYHRG